MAKPEQSIEANSRLTCSRMIDILYKGHPDTGTIFIKVFEYIGAFRETLLLDLWWYSVIQYIAVLCTLQNTVNIQKYFIIWIILISRMYINFPSTGSHL